MASEKAKELAAKQKAELKAAKLAKKNSSDPKDWGWFKQLAETYKMTVKADPASKWILLGVIVAGIVVFTAVGLIFFLSQWWMWVILGLVAGITAAMYVLVNRAKRASYIRYKGQPGSGEVALSMLDKKTWTCSPAVTATKQLDVVHRAVGPAGIVLIGEGSTTRLKAILASEVKKHEQVAYGVPVSTLIMGDGDGQVPLDKLATHLRRMPKTMSKTQAAEVNQRLKALDAIRPRVPIPRGPLTVPKHAAKALRG